MSRPSRPSATLPEASSERASPRIGSDCQVQAKPTNSQPRFLPHSWGRVGRGPACAGVGSISAPPGFWPPSPRQARRGRVQESAPTAKFRQSQQTLNHDSSPRNGGGHGGGRPRGSGCYASPSRPLATLPETSSERASPSTGSGTKFRQSQQTLNHDSSPIPGGGQGGGRPRGGLFQVRPHFGHPRRGKLGWASMGRL